MERKMTRPARPIVVPKARSLRSCVRRAAKRFARRKGKHVIPPRAMKFPAAKGDQRRFAAAAPNTGKLASQEPKMKKQSIENQHIHAMTPHWDRVISENRALYDSSMGEEECVTGGANEKLGSG